MESPREKSEKKVASYQRQLKEYGERIREKEAEIEKERAKPPKLRTRKLSDIREEIRQLQAYLWKSKPKKRCPHCGKELYYDDILCFRCGEVFLDVCPKCSSIRIGMSEWGNIKCLECGLEYNKRDMFRELLIGCADPSSPYLRILNRQQVSGLNCYNIGTNKNTIWELCEQYNCPFEEECEYYCPAFLSVLGLIERGKVTTGLPWGYDQGGDLHGYRIRWRRPKRKRE
jgi:hypothetical protein